VTLTRFSWSKSNENVNQVINFGMEAFEGSVSPDGFWGRFSTGNGWNPES
jgi:hypothetical protein